MHGWLCILIHLLVMQSSDYSTHSWALVHYVFDDVFDVAWLFTPTQPLTHGRKHAEKFFGCRPPPPFFTRLNTLFSQIRGEGVSFYILGELVLCYTCVIGNMQTSIKPASIICKPASNQHQTSIKPAPIICKPAYCLQ